MAEQFRRIKAEERKSTLLGKHLAALAKRVHQLRDAQFDVLSLHEERLLINMEQALLALAKLRIGTRG